MNKKISEVDKVDKKSNLNKFLTFMENDLYRSLKIMVPIILLFFLGHIGAVIYRTNNFNNYVLDTLRRNRGLSRAEVIKPIYDNAVGMIINPAYVGMIMLISFVVIVSYTLILWNREWRGSSKSIYTTLSIPFKRVNILVAKICVIFIFLSVNLALQIAALFIDNALIKAMVAKEFTNNISVISYFSREYVMYGNNFNGLYGHYLVFEPRIIISDIVLALSMILLLGLIILLLRSFKLKGGVLGVIIFMAYMFLYGFIPAYFKFYLFEKLWFYMLFPLGISILSFIFSKYLIENKISV